MLNADMEFYKLAGIRDIGDIIVHLDIRPENDKRGIIAGRAAGRRHLRRGRQRGRQCIACACPISDDAIHVLKHAEGRKA